MAGQARTLLRLRGPDTRRFLHGTLTASLETQPDDVAVAAALLTVKGKLVSDAIVLTADGGDGADLLVPSVIGSEVAELIDRHIIMDEVEVESAGEAAFAIAWGDPLQPSQGIQVFSTRHPAPEQLILAEAEGLLERLNADAVDEQAWHRHRIDTASPAWGAELEAGHFPPEVGFVHAVAYNKGCYLGQEPLARIHARGQVNWVMVRVGLTSTIAAPAKLSHESRPEAGRLTTAVGDAGLAIVRRTFAKPGESLQTDDGQTVEVLSEPLGDDPGLAGRRGAGKVRLGGK